MKQLLLLLFLSLITCGLQAQKNQAKRIPLYKMKVGTSFTFKWDYDDAEHQEYTWAINTAWQFNTRLSAGLNFLTIRDDSPFRESFTAFMGGPYGQFKLTDGRLWDLSAETGFYLGNYCTCDWTYNVPYKKNGLVYWAHGIAANVRITRAIHLDLSFINHIILNDVPQKYNFTQYVIGLDFFFVKN